MLSLKIPPPFAILNITILLKKIGLSATPGKNLQNIKEVVKALKVSKIEARLDSDEEVKKYVHSREIEKIIVEPTDAINVVTSLFGKLLNPLLDDLRDRGCLRTFRGSNSTITSYNLLVARRDLNEKYNDYTMNHVIGTVQSLLRAREGLRENGMAFSRKRLRDFMTKNSQTSSGYIQSILQSKSFEKLWNAIVKTQDIGGACPTPSQLMVNNPKLSKLVEVLNEHFERAKSTNCSSRAIVFSQWRDSVEEIVHVLNASRPLVCPKKFVGQSSSSSSTDKSSNNEKRLSSKVTGMNQKEQQRVIQEFRTGLHNVLVCTW